jgi:hypothetical protein
MYETAAGCNQKVIDIELNQSKILLIYHFGQQALCQTLIAYSTAGNIHNLRRGLHGWSRRASGFCNLILNRYLEIQVTGNDKI